MKQLTLLATAYISVNVLWLSVVFATKCKINVKFEKNTGRFVQTFCKATCRLAIGNYKKLVNINNLALKFLI